MTALLPTRVSLYDFLLEDTLPIDSVFADIGNISIPQARVLIENGIQAIISALMAYNQAQGSEAVLKKLLNRTQVKELRKYNAFNFKTMNVAYQNGNAVSEVLFHTPETQKQICQKLAKQADLRTVEVRHLLGALSLLCLREVAILVDFAQLDMQEVNDWFALQPQFFQLDRDCLGSSHCETEIEINTATSTSASISVSNSLPVFDQSWHAITGYKQPTASNDFNTDQIPHYAKVIGRTNENNRNLAVSENGQVVVDNSNNSDVLTFDSMNNISLPYQRWLLQLAKISDIYLSRKRLKIAPEPVQPPSRPFVNFSFKDIDNPSSNDNPTTHSESSDSHTPLWKNPVILLLVLVLGGLSLLAVGKYQYKKSHSIDSPAETETKIEANPIEA